MATSKSGKWARIYWDEAMGKAGWCFAAHDGKPSYDSTSDILTSDPAGSPEAEAKRELSDDALLSMLDAAIPGWCDRDAVEIDRDSRYGEYPV